MTYSFDGQEGCAKQTRQSKLDIHFHIPNNIDNLSYHNALLNNASVMRDSFSEPFDVLLSGGIDSEVVVRTFHELGIKHNTVIFKYEDDLNIRDVKSSIQICDALNIPYKIIDFNLRKFYENEASSIFEKTFVPNLASLSRIKWLEYLDNIPVFGEGEPYWTRDLAGDYSQKSAWTFNLSETELFITLNEKYINRPIIGEWYQYTPNIMASYYRDPIIADLLEDKFVGKQSVLSTRVNLHRQFWPEIEDKSKLTGYEGPTGLPWTDKPDFFLEFSNKHKLTEVSSAKFKFSLDQMNNIFKKDIHEKNT